MTAALRLRVTLGVLAIFAAGVVSGAFFGARLQLEKQSKQAEINNLPESVMAMLDQRLSLSKEQSAEMTPLVEQACTDLRQVYKENFAEVGDILRKYYGLMAPKLSAEQAKTLEKMEAELRAKADELKN